nr:MAG TPA: hypothetical protein [Caudoviricetes sp.]
MCEFFCPNIIQHPRYNSVRCCETLREIPHGCAHLSIRSTGMQYQMICCNCKNFDDTICFPG